MCIFRDTIFLNDYINIYIYTVYILKRSKEDWWELCHMVHQQPSEAQFSIRSHVNYSHNLTFFFRVTVFNNGQKSHFAERYDVTVKRRFDLFWTLNVTISFCKTFGWIFWLWLMYEFLDYGPKMSLKRPWWPWPLTSKFYLAHPCVQVDVGAKFKDIYTECSWDIKLSTLAWPHIWTTQNMICLIRKTTFIRTCVENHPSTSISVQLWRKSAELRCDMCSTPAQSRQVADGDIMRSMEIAVGRSPYCSTQRVTKTHNVENPAAHQENATETEPIS